MFLKGYTNYHEHLQSEKEGGKDWRMIDAPPSSSMDSTTSPKVKTTEGKGVGVCSLAHNISGVEGCAGILGWD
jgi:hypothetical protein